MKKLLVVLLILLSDKADAACQKYIPRVLNAQTGTRIPQYIVCDTTAEQPGTGVADGDLSYMRDTDILWLRAAGVWLDISTPGGGVGGAPNNAQYWVGAADAGLTAEKDLGALATGLVINTAGVPTAYAGTNAGSNEWLRHISAVGAGTFLQPGFANLSGIATVVQGGTGAAPPSDDRIVVSDSTIAATWRILPNCEDMGGNHLNYDNVTNTWSCGTSSSGLTHPQVLARQTVGF